MEDHLISPWQYQQNHTLNNFYTQSKRPQLKPIQRHSLKNRIIFTQCDDSNNNYIFNKKQQSNNIRKKGQSTSTYQNFYQRRISHKPTKLQIKLVSYPITQKQNQKQKEQKQHDKFVPVLEQQSSKNFQVLETIYKTKSNQARVFRSNAQQTNPLIEKKIRLKFNRKTHQINKQNQKLDVMKKAQLSYRISLDYNYLPSLKNNQHNFLQYLLKQKELGLKNKLMNRNSHDRKVYEWKSNHNQQLQDAIQDRTGLNKQQNKQEEEKVQQTVKNKIKTKVRDQNGIYMSKTCSKHIHKSRTYSRDMSIDQNNSLKNNIQKLQNINCFKDNTNVFTSLKQKNKTLFNQLQKYNLFGLRNIKKINAKKK